MHTRKEISLISRHETKILKGYAISAVILEHATGLGLITFLTNKSAGILCEIGMGIFLFLSGYGLYKSYLKNGLKQYWEKKITKIIFPYSMIQFILLFFSFVDKKNTFTAEEIIVHLLGIIPENKLDSTMWYISFLLFLYFVFFVVFSFFSIRKAMIIWGIMPIILFVLCPHIWKYSFYCTMSFPFGVFYSCYEEKIKNIFKMKVIVVLELISLILLYVWYRNYRLSYLFENLLVLYFTLTFIISIKLINRRINLDWLEKIGEISFFLYLIEYKFILINLYMLVHKYNLGEVFQKVLLVLFFVGMLFIANCLTKFQNYISNRIRL